MRVEPGGTAGTRPARTIYEPAPATTGPDRSRVLTESFAAYYARLSYILTLGIASNRAKTAKTIRGVRRAVRARARGRSGDGAT